VEKKRKCQKITGLLKTIEKGNYNFRSAIHRHKIEAEAQRKKTQKMPSQDRLQKERVHSVKRLYLCLYVICDGFMWACNRMCMKDTRISRKSCETRVESPRSKRHLFESPLIFEKSFKTHDSFAQAVRPKGRRFLLTLCT
jgi:hypothetical protein